MMGAKAIDLTGKRFGKLVVLGRVGSASNGGVVWTCKCDCGNVKDVAGTRLRGAFTKGCGCLIGAHLKKHGKSTTPEYRVWAAMIARCHNQNDPGYTFYGAKGISVCNAWRNSFANFLSDMGDRPTKDHSIDRIDNMGGYSPENCRWATETQQQRNRRSNVRIVFGGQTKSLIEWAEHFSIPYDVLRNRYVKLKWEFDVAIATPVRPHRAERRGWIKATPCAQSIVREEK